MKPCIPHNRKCKRQQRKAAWALPAMAKAAARSSSEISSKLLRYKKNLYHQEKIQKKLYLCKILKT
jgi:hypothetical protein